MRALQCLVEELEHDLLLHEPDRLCRRIEALDRLEAYLLDGSGEAEFHHRATALSTRMEAANLKLYRTIRQQIQQGTGPHSLLGWVKKSGEPSGAGYDCLDELIVGVLQFQEPEREIAPLSAEMVFYQPTPARHIFDLFSRTTLTGRDVLVDLGSGLGHVPLLASICTTARSIGIELESAYVACARESAQSLNLNNVTFLQQDARTADLSLGTVFYLYTPFSGTILHAVLDSLRREAARRQIRICTFGPCTATLAHQHWLEAAGALAEDRIAVFYPRT